MSEYKLNTSFGVNGKVISNITYDYVDILSIKIFNNKILVAGYYKETAQFMNEYIKTL